MASQTIYIEIPGSDIKLYPGYKIKLNRFDSDIWTVHYGWYDFSGNRPIMGWYLTNDSDCNSVKPIQKIDTYDIYLVDTSNKEDVDVETIQSDYTENNNLEGSYIKNRPFYADKFDSLDSRYNDCEISIIPYGEGTAIQYTFNDIHFDIDTNKEYTVTGKTNTESITTQVTFKAYPSGMYCVVNEYTAYIVYNGKVGTDTLSGNNKLVPKQNQLSFIWNQDDSAEWFKVSIEDVEFDYIKQAEQVYLKDEYRYVTYRYPYFHFDASSFASTQTQATLSIGVPVFSYYEPTRTYTNFAKNGIRYGNFLITGEGGLKVEVDLFPKDQEWELWTFNQVDNNGTNMRLGIGTVINTMLVSEGYIDHVVNMLPYYKSYILTMPHSSVDGVVWAGVQMTIMFDTQEHCQEFVDYVNSLEYDETSSMTVRIKDIDYIEESVELAVPEWDGD